MDEVDRIPISALQHWHYCPRQCALIHLEQAFAENVHTMRGQAVHAAVDIPAVEAQAGLRIERSLPIWSDRLWLGGKADLVEFLPGGTPFPVEYKYGSRGKSRDLALCDDVQLTAQAMCLEEMTGKAVTSGALFYSRSRRRRQVAITPSLRALVEETVASVRGMLSSAIMPPPTLDRSRCRACSLRDICQPEALSALSQISTAGADLFDPGA